MVILEVPGATDDFISTFFDNDIFNAVALVMTKQIQAIAIGLSVMLFLIILGYNYVKNALDTVTGEGSSGKIVDIKDVVRCFVIIALIAMYSETIYPALNGTVKGINALTASSSFQQENFSTQVQEYMQKQTEQEKKQNITAAKQTLNDPKASAEDKQVAQQIVADNSDNDDSSWWDDVWGYLNPISLVSRLCAWIFGEAMNLIAGIVKMIVGVLAAILFKFLLVMGPLALAVSIVPVFRNQIDIWFGTLINVGLVLTTMHILDCFCYGLLNIIFSANSFTFEDGTVTSVVNMTIVILYLMSFWLTSKWVGKGDGGRFISKTVSLATMAVTAAIGASMLAGGGAGKGGANVNNVFSAFKNRSKNNSSDMFHDGE